MYPNSPTETEKFIQMIEQGSPDVKAVIREYIDNHDISKMQQGVDYYFSKGDISKRNMYIYDEAGNKHIDPDATNNKLASGWHKLLVDQKTAYLVGDPLTVGSKTDKEVDDIVEAMGEEFEDVMPELVKGASNKGIEWLHPFIDEEGNFDYIVIPAQEFIPIYDNSKRKNLEGGIRYYNLDDDTLKVELWDKDKVTYYEATDNGELVLDVNEEVNPAPHFYYGKNGYGWGDVPFIGFKNNEECVSDLTFYKTYIDAYDKLMSDVSNTLDDIQSMVYVLKGYEGTNLAQFMNELKRYKIISMSDEQGSGVDTLSANVPVDATTSHLQQLTEDIYAWGQGVNNSPDKFGNAPSGVAIRNLYSLLDMKANVLERKFAKSLEKFVWFVCEYLSISGKGDYDYKDITFTFNKTMLANEAETIDMLEKTEISLRTKLENNPFVKDVEEELKRIKEEEDEFSRHLPSIEPLFDPDQGKSGSGDSVVSDEVTCPECGGDGEITSDKTGNLIQCPTCKGTGVVGR